MTPLLLLSLAHAGNLPDVVVRWKKTDGHLAIEAPAGEHLAPEAPIAGWVELNAERTELIGDGAQLEEGLALSLTANRANMLQGVMRVSLCEDGGTLCRLVDFTFIGTVEGRKGEVHLAVTEPPADLLIAEPAPPEDSTPEGSTPEGPAPNGKALTPEEAFAAAAAEDKLVLLDFYAIWCPPCLQLGAEVLHDPNNAEDLAPFFISQVDADARESWAIKDRYAVGGYPTIVATTPDGAELDRMVGYPGEAAFLAWLDALAAGLTPIDALAAELASLSPAEAGAAALRLARAGRPDDAARALEAADDGVDAHLAALELEPTEDTLLWLAEQAPERIYEWGFAALRLELSEEATQAIDAAAVAAIPQQAAPQAADLLYLRAALAPEGEAEALYRQSLQTLESALTGDPEHDAGHYGFLASLYQEVGEPEAGLEVLMGGIEAYPEDFTFHHAAAGLLKEMGRLEEALVEAESAARWGYDDNRLRAIKRQAELLDALNRRPEAIALLEQTLADAERPEDGVEVRTHRYLDQLEGLRAELTSESEETAP